MYDPPIRMVFVVLSYVNGNPLVGCLITKLTDEGRGAGAGVGAGAGAGVGAGAGAGDGTSLLHKAPPLLFATGFLVSWNMLGLVT